MIESGETYVIVTNDLAVTSRADPAGQVIEPESGEGLDADDTPEAVALVPEDQEAALSAEEGAMRFDDDAPPAGGER